MIVFVGLFVGLSKTGTEDLYSMTNLSPYNSMTYLVRPAEFESATPWFVARCTIQCLRGLWAILSHKNTQIPPNNHAGLTTFCGSFS